MGYKLYIDALDVRVQEAINYLLEDNMDSLSIYEGLEVDINFDDMEDDI